MSSTDFEHLDKHNGLLLCPNDDNLFDKGLITFKETGKHPNSQYPFTVTINEF
ncbi:HNH endonuclease [Lysinibacillus sp. NPDC097287]|uniref:HNH endonuclease n=1 Tax=Lysinibacillus sp. NPDC097287 TaxID=3364144 RepID=UPI00380CF0F5